MEFWLDLIKLLGGASILLAATAWLIKSIVSVLLSKNVENYKNELRITSASTIEKARADLKEQLESNLDHLSRKRDVYVRLINSMRALLDESDIKDKAEFIRAYNETCLWAPPNVADSISNLLALAKEKNTNQTDLVERYTRCLLEMRKDCGFTDHNFEYHIIKFNNK
ncbi:MAG: hypothetical protein R3E57_01745 [Porticoccaceae bacterium]